MEELKLLIGMVADLPSMALWVLIGYLVYKLAIIGSIYGVIRLAITNLYEWAIKRKELPAIHQEIYLKDIVHGICIHSDETKDLLMRQIKRVAGKGISIGSDYIHKSSVDWLREAIDDKIEKDADKEKAKAA
jgi:hypothetical protein